MPVRPVRGLDRRRRGPREVSEGRDNHGRVGVDVFESVLDVFNPTAITPPVPLPRYAAGLDKGDSPGKPLPAEVFVNIHKAVSVVDGEEVADGVYCKVYLVGDKRPFGVAANFEEGEDEKS